MGSRLEDGSAPSPGALRVLWLLCLCGSLGVRSGVEGELALCLLGQMFLEAFYLGFTVSFRGQ